MNRFLSTSAISLAVALARPVTSLLPLASPYTFIPLLMMRPAGLAVGAGLFSAAMCGIDVDGLLAGAADMDGVCSQEQLGKNPAAMLAYLLVELGQSKGKSNHVMMPYANALYLLADW